MYLILMYSMGVEGGMWNVLLLGGRWEMVLAAEWHRVATYVCRRHGVSRHGWVRMPVVLMPYLDLLARSKELVLGLNQPV